MPERFGSFVVLLRGVSARDELLGLRSRQSSGECLGRSHESGVLHTLGLFPANFLVWDLYRL